MSMLPNPERRVRYSMLIDGGILMLAAIGLAAVFNSMNPKSIPWVKKEIERTQATAEELDKYIQPSVPAQVPVATPPAVVATETAGAATTSAPSSTAPTARGSSQPAVVTTPAFVAEPGMIREIGHDAFVKLMQSGPFYLIDARGPEKFAEGHIPGAVNIYGGEAESRIPDIMRAPRDRVILIYCDGGECELSHHVADVLKQFNYGPIFIYTGGWAEWKTKH
ncbi:MAG: hypothetical protein RL594_487 [Bacteroidota bacterium]|jgi:rhodanese-related sulfurtransferase